MRIGVLGCGTIASAAVAGSRRTGMSSQSRGAAKSTPRRWQTATPMSSIAENQGVVDASDVIFLGLAAEVAQDVLGALTFREDKRIISFMAGATLSQADAMVKPARAVAIMMPFPAIAQGGTPIMMHGDADLVREIFGARNSIFPLRNAEEMAAYLCAQAVLSPVAR